jgi:hypothetical protein
MSVVSYCLNHGEPHGQSPLSLANPPGGHLTARRSAKTGAFPRTIKKRLHAEVAARRATMTAYRRNLLFLWWKESSESQTSQDRPPQGNQEAKRYSTVRFNIFAPFTSVSKRGTIARTLSPKIFQISAMCSSCIRTRFRTNSAASFPTCSF